MARKIKLGLVGCGYWGPNLLRNFVQTAGTEVVAICDQKKARLAPVTAGYPFLEKTSSFDELLAKKIEAVVIATPLASHFLLVKQALRAGKHVLVEKPFVASLEEGRELVRLAQEKKLVLMVDHTFEYAPAVQKIKELVQAGKLGKIYTLEMIRTNLGLFRPDHNVIWDLAYHDVSILLFVLQRKPVNVIAVGQDSLQSGMEDSAAVILKFPGQTLVCLYLSWLTPLKVRKMTLVGSKKMLVYDDTEPAEKIKIFDRGVTVDHQAGYRYRQGDIFIPYLEPKEPLRVVAEHFLECVREKKPPRSGGREALAVMQILVDINRSLKNSLKNTPGVGKALSQSGEKK